jgi:hypothetical protein
VALDGLQLESFLIESEAPVEVEHVDVVVGEREFHGLTSDGA